MQQKCKTLILMILLLQTHKTRTCSTISNTVLILPVASVHQCMYHIPGQSIAAVAAVQETEPSFAAHVRHTAANVLPGASQAWPGNTPPFHQRELLSSSQLRHVLPVDLALACSPAVAYQTTCGY